MKRYLALLLAAALFTIFLSGCTIGGVKQTNETLTIWLDDPRYANDYKDIISTFQSEHPDVVVTVAQMPAPVYMQGSIKDPSVYQESFQEVTLFERETLPAYYEKLSQDMIVGKGPDIMLFKPEVFNDLHKTMAAGAFCDLNEFLTADPDYKPEEYQQTVISAGMMNDKQFVMPLFYRLPGLVTAQETIGQDFPFTEKDGYYDAVGKLAAYKQAGGILPVYGENHSQANSNPIGYTNFTGTVNLDYEKQHISFDEIKFKQLQEWNKLLYNAPKAHTLDEMEWRSGVSGLTNTEDRYYTMPESSAFVLSKKEHQRLLFPFDRMESCLTVAAGIQNVLGQTPVIAPIRDADGKTQASAVYGAAIRNNSENKQNAYDFLKLVISPKMQFQLNRDCFTPIHKEMAEKSINYAKVRSKESSLIAGDEYYEHWKNWLNEIDGASFPTKLDDWMLEYFVPFYKGEKSYEDCLQTAKDQLEIYISE